MKLKITIKDWVNEWIKTIMMYHHIKFQLPDAFHQNYMNVQSCIISTFISINILHLFLQTNFQNAKIAISMKHLVRDSFRNETIFHQIWIKAQSMTWWTFKMFFEASKQMYVMKALDNVTFKLTFFLLKIRKKNFNSFADSTCRIPHTCDILVNVCVLTNKAPQLSGRCSVNHPS